ncbi:MAG: TIGR00341 family protein [Longimicrobiales bacterium]|nr:TIGR00341 family protein [Longimicrobiales bacterium]
MSLRLIEVSLRGTPVEVDDLARDFHVVDAWGVDTTNGGSSLRLLVEAERTEALIDTLRDRFSGSDLRIVVLTVEATVPKVEEEIPEEETDDATPGRISREELHDDVAHAARLTPVFVAMVVLSTVVAAVGLVRDDVAIVIGAMVIAPLLGPNMALAFAATLGDTGLARTALRTIAVGVGTAGVCAIAFGMLFTIDPSVPGIADRTQAGLGDIALGFAAGAAGTLAVTGGLPSAVVGVMVAVALLPPLVVAGLLTGAGYPEGATGALLLVGTNVACINLAAVGTFLIQRVRPRSWWEADRARDAIRIAVISWVALLLLLLATILFGEIGLELS